MKKVTLLLTAFLLALFADAQKKWTLQECIDYALENNISLMQNKISSAQREVEVSAMKAALFPSLSVNTNQSVNYRPYSETTINLTNGSMTSSSSQTTYNGNYAVSANWTVWNGNKNRDNIKASQLSKELADLKTEQSSNTIQEQIAQLFVQILYQTEAIKVDSEIVKFSIMQKDRAVEMFNVGSLAKVDVAQLEAQVTQDQYALVSAKSQLENFKLQLKQLLEIHGSEPFNVEIPVLADAAVLTPIPTQKSVYEKALQLRPEIQSGKLSIDAARLDEKIARSGYMPTVNMNASMATSNSSGNNNAFSKQLKRNWSNNVGVSVSMPIFDQKQTKTAVSRAKLNIQNSELQLQDSEKKLYSEIETYWLNATTSQQQYIYAKTNVESMKESYNLVSEQFKLGLKNIVELTTGKNNLLSAQQQMLQSKYTALYNISMLKFYQGDKVKL